MYYNKNNVTVDVTEIVNGKVQTEEWEQVITEEAKLVVTHNNDKYYVNCYYTGDHDEGSDTYAIRVYDNEAGYNDFSSRDEHEIADMYLFSDGSSVADEGLRLEDTEVEEAIMEVLFGGDKPVIVAF